MVALDHPMPIATKPESRKTRWLAALEMEIKRRIGWVDEAISPFARKRRRRDADAKIWRAA